MNDDTWTPDFGELDGTPLDWAAKRPQRIAILGDFSAGAAKGRLETGADLARRKLISVEFDNLEDTLSRLEVKLALPIGDGGEGVEVEFPDLDAFHPDALYRGLPVFSALADLRKRLNSTATFAKAAAQVQAMGGSTARRASKTNRRRSRGGAPAAGAKLSDFARLVGFESEVRTDAPVDALLRRIVGPFVTVAPDPKRDALVATVDAALSDAMRAVLHQSEFQNLEALWRGLDMLLRRLETGPSLQVLLLDMSAEEFAADLSSVGDLSESGLYALLVDQPSQEKAGGVSLICGLYQFEASPPHAELLGRMAKIAAKANATFVTSINTDTLADRKADPHPLVVEAMQALKGLPEASHLALMAPRFLLRHPYGKRSDPVGVFDFEEFTATDGLRGMLWGHPALIAASLLAAPRGQTLSIGDLPFHFVVDADGDQVALPCTERLVHLDAAGRLRSYGINALMAKKGEPELRAAGLESLSGRPLSLQAGPKAGPRASISTSIRTSSGERDAGSRAKAAPAPVRAAASGAEVEAGEAATSETATSEASTAADAAGSSPDTSLDDLLASLGDGDATPSEASPSEGDAAPAADDAEMDPDLAALLKSLEG